MNNCSVSGNLGADPESFYTPEGTNIVSFNIGFRSYKDKTNWIKVVTFNKTAEVAMKHLHKGDRIAVTGIIDQTNWETQEGQHRTGFRLIAKSIEFIKVKNKEPEDETPEPTDTDVPF